MGSKKKKPHGHVDLIYGYGDSLIISDKIVKIIDLIYYHIYISNNILKHNYMI
jgi:hypothetical protein